MGFGDFLGKVYNGVGSTVGGTFDWLGQNKGDQQAGPDREFLNRFMAQGNPYMQGQSPQAGNQSALIQMLQQAANGQGPSLAGDAYRQASEQAMNNALAMSHGASAGSARAATNQLGNINQGLANGLATARNQEIVGARGQLGGAINMADQSQMARDKANQDAWLQLMMQRLGLTRQQMQGKTNGDVLGGLVQGAGQAAAMA